ncbi:hypothetical protein OKA05_03745 [Luteolibacter arcticus]|uniref:Uncharacterized protein n=1 Tax=Luteolibacter arcticus TaxID=1581411 RepID=A0ABT3GDY5_9BACT|nr:hypothetical protein [Luteolibacter arcticus]MCW1921651.1 hypothetical protein [Luteolibacter arcticus]
MKPLPLLFAALGLLASAPTRGDEPRRSGRGPEVLPPGLLPPANDVSGDEAFIARRDAAGAARPKPVARKAKDYSIAELSAFISNGETHAILPKGSVVFCPDAVATRVSNKAVGKPVAWPDFLVANRNWISTHEVTLPQIRGEAPLSESDRKAFAAAGRIVIATLRGNPVTVLPVTVTPP